MYINTTSILKPSSPSELQTSNLLSDNDKMSAQGALSGMAAFTIAYKLAALIFETLNKNVHWTE